MAADDQIVILLKERLKTTNPARRGAADALIGAIRSGWPRSEWERRALSGAQARPETAQQISDLCRMLDIGR